MGCGRERHDSGVGQRSLGAAREFRRPCICGGLEGWFGEASPQGLSPGLFYWPFSARLKPSPDTGPVSRGSCYPTLRRNEGEGWGTHFRGRVKVTKSRSRSFGSAEKRFAQDDASVGKEQGTGSREQRTENREQRTENREQREQRTENREQRTENREQRTENREQRTEKLCTDFQRSCERSIRAGRRGGRQEPTPQAEIQIEFLVNGLFHLIQSDRSRWRSA